VTQLGGRFDRCPKAWLRDDASEEAELIGDVMAFREHHIAPCAGGLLDQPPLWVEAGEEVVFQLDPLGSVSIRFAPAAPRRLL